MNKRPKFEFRIQSKWDPVLGRMVSHKVWGKWCPNNCMWGRKKLVKNKCNWCGYKYAPTRK